MKCTDENIRIVYPNTKIEDVQKCLEERVKELCKESDTFLMWIRLYAERRCGEGNISVSFIVAGIIIQILGIVFGVFKQASGWDIIFTVVASVVAGFFLWNGLVDPLLIRRSYQIAEKAVVKSIRSHAYRFEGEKEVSEEHILDWLEYIFNLNQFGLPTTSLDVWDIFFRHRCELFCGLTVEEGNKYMSALADLNRLEKSPFPVRYLCPAERSILLFREEAPDMISDGPVSEVYVGEYQINEMYKENSKRGEDAFIVDLTFLDDIFGRAYVS